MQLFILGCLIMLIGGWIALLIKNKAVSYRLANLGLFIGSGLISIPVIATLMGTHTNILNFGWLIQGGTLSFRLDALSAFFCLPVLIISPLAMVYGRSYLANQDKPLGKHWFFFNLLTASMLLLMVSNNSLMFLIIWEVMTLASFFLVMYDDEKAEVRSAGWTYLIAAHIGAAALLVFFAILGKDSGSLQFDTIAKTGNQSALSIAILFVLAIFGFGIKAGFVPLHVWLPEAHPAAPSHISALMSGVMIKTGIYGILRALVLIGHPTAYMGWTLVIIGMTSGIAGVVFALAQHDLKRLLAYHSVENIGIITLGIGTGVLGLVWNIPALAILGFGGGLLHVLNHALFKSLLFFCAGAVTHITGTRNIELLGGLFKKARWTGWTFLIGSAAISGLPPFNGFVSEFFIYFAGISGIKTAAPGPIILAACVLTSLALIGGLAVACFSKAFGIIFLGEPRSEQARNAHEADVMMRLPMFVLSLLCIMVGLLAPLTIYLILFPVQTLVGTSVVFAGSTAGIVKVLSIITLLFALLIILAGLFYLLRRKLPRGTEESCTGTWDCGFAAPDAGMQYTASSFADPLTELFKPLLGTKQHGKDVTGYFPAQADFHSETPDAAREKLFAPVFILISRIISPIRKVQHGNLNGYLLYIAITLIALLVWKTGFH